MGGVGRATPRARGALGWASAARWGTFLSRPRARRHRRFRRKGGQLNDTPLHQLRGVDGDGEAAAPRRCSRRVGLDAQADSGALRGEEGGVGGRGDERARRIESPRARVRLLGADIVKR